MGPNCLMQTQPMVASCSASCHVAGVPWLLLASQPRKGRCRRLSWQQQLRSHVQVMQSLGEEGRDGRRWEGGEMAVERSLTRLGFCRSNHERGSLQQRLRRQMLLRGRHQRLSVPSADFRNFRFNGMGPLGGSSPDPSSLRHLITDIRRFGLSGILFAAISFLRLYSQGDFGAYGNGLLDGLAQIWFIFILLDLALTISTWVIANRIFSISSGVCPACGTAFFFRKEYLQGIMICPSCYELIRCEKGELVRDRPRFRADFDQFIDVEADVEDLIDLPGGQQNQHGLRKGASLPPVVEVDAKVFDIE